MTAPSRTTTRRSRTVRNTPAPTATAATPCAARATTPARWPSYDEAIAIDPNYVLAHSGRGYALFGKGDFAAAATDFLRALKIKNDAEAVLWLYLARARAREDAIAELKENGERLGNRNWPYAVIEFYAGGRSVADLLAAAKGDQSCVAQFFLGQWHVLHRNHAQAVAALRAASERCPKTFVHYDIALVELRRLNP